MGNEQRMNRDNSSEPNPARRMTRHVAAAMKRNAPLRRLTMAGRLMQGPLGQFPPTTRVARTT